MDQKMRTWTPEQSLQAFKEGVTAFLGIILVGYTLYIANSVLIFVGDQQKMSDAKDVLLLLLGLAGVVIGYYFGRVPADARAVQAQEQARTATIQAEQVATQTRSATDQIDQLFSRMSSTAEAGATRGGPEAGSETQDVMAEMKRIRESLRQVSSNSR